MVIPLKESGQVLDGEWEYHFESDPVKKVQLPIYQNLEHPSSARFSYTPKKSDYTTLALLWPNMTSLNIYWNNILIYSLGDRDNPSGNFWNYFHIIQLPLAPTGNDELIFEVTGYYNINFERIPYLEKRNIIYTRASIHNFIYNDMLTMFIGCSLVLGIILLLLPQKDKELRLTNILMGISALLASIHFLDYTFSPFLGNIVLYEIVKKIFYLAGPLSSLFLCLTLESFYKGKIDKTRYLIIPSSIAIASIMILDLVLVRTLIPYINILLLINLLWAVIIVLSNKELKLYFLISSYLLLLSLVQIVLVLLLRLSLPLVMQNMIFISSFLCGFQLFIHYKTIHQQHDILSGENIRDPLTGAFNRRYMDRIDPSGFSVLAVIDMDNFKYYNDSYGHQAGDVLLKDFTEIISQNLRQNDMVIRYGGDEFILYLKDVSHRDGINILKRIEQDLRQLLNKEDKVGISYGLQKLEKDSNTNLYKADQAMYKMKRSKKNKQKSE